MINQDYGKDWAFDHLTNNEALSARDKYFAKKEKSLSKGASKLSNIDFDTNNRGDNEDSNLDNFVSDSVMRYNILKKNSDFGDDYDINNDSDADELNEIDANKTYLNRRDRKRLKKQMLNEGLMKIDTKNKNGNDDDDSDLESSGDDLDIEPDNSNFHAQQIEDGEDIDDSVTNNEMHGLYLHFC